jgi:hypothetical protein
MDFEIVSEIAEIETIATRRRVRDRNRLRKFYGGAQAKRSCAGPIGEWYDTVSRSALVRSARSGKTRIQIEVAIVRLGMKKKELVHFVVCLDNEGYPASLEVGKLYRYIPDREAEAEGLLRVVDESGEDYGFEAKRFHEITVPPVVEKALLVRS